MVKLISQKITLRIWWFLALVMLCEKIPILTFFAGNMESPSKQDHRFKEEGTRSGGSPNQAWLPFQTSYKVP
jgi:hypothetical protein